MLTWLESSPGGNQRDMLQHLLLQQTLMLSYTNWHRERDERKEKQIQDGRQNHSDHQTSTDALKRHDLSLESQTDKEIGLRQEVARVNTDRRGGEVEYIKSLL